MMSFAGTAKALDFTADETVERGPGPAGPRVPSRTPSLLVTIGLSAGIIGLLTLPSGVRDILSVALLISLIGVSFMHVRIVWLYALATVPLFHLLFGLFDQPKITGVRLLLAALLIPVLVGRSTRRAVFEGFQTRTGFWFGMFVVANVIAAIVAGDVEAVFRAVVYLEPLLFFLFTYSIVKSKGATFEEVLGSVAVGGWIVAFSAMVEVVAHQAFTDVLGIQGLPGEADVLSVYLSDDRFGLGGRIISTIGQPVYAGIYFGIWAFCCGLCGLPQRWTAKVFWIFSASVAVVLLIATGSRGPLTGLVVGGALFVAFSRTRRRSLMAVIAVIIPAAVAVLIRFNDIAAYLRETVSFDPRSTEAGGVMGRLDLTTQLMDIFRANPLFGVGPGLIQKAGLRGAAAFVDLKGVENQYATILADAGILAGLSYLMFMVSTFRDVQRAQQEPDSPFYKQSGAVMLALFAYYFVCVVSATCLASVPNYLLMAVAGAFLADAHRRSAGADRPVTPVHRPRRRWSIR